MKFEKWKNTIENYNNFWDNNSKRNLCGVVVVKPFKDDFPIPPITQKNSIDFSISPEQIVDRIEYELKVFEYFGDAFPRYGMDCFGPGIVAAFFGAIVDNKTGSIWFHADRELDYSNLDLAIDYQNKYLVRLAQIYKIATQRFGSCVAAGMTDLGGLADILYTFRNGEKLLYDLIDYPEEVKAVLEIICNLWHEVYNYFLSLMPENRYTDWSTLYSNKPFYTIQSDFSYMVGKDTFDEILLPTIAEQCSRLERTIYHLDGVGQLQHLDSLLRIKELNAVQWIQGEGKPSSEEWLNVYRKILDAGKSVQLSWCSIDSFKKISKKFGSNIHRPMIYVAEKDKKEALDMLKELKIEC